MLIRRRPCLKRPTAATRRPFPQRAILLLAAVAACSAAAEPLPEPITIGRIAEAQGLVSVRPTGGDRWTPVTEERLLAPGDWVRTDVRGANAARVRLADGGSAILGPGTLAEFTDARTVRVSRGELELTGAKGKPVAAGLPGETAGATAQTTPCLAPTVLRVRDGALSKLDREPSWLQGFKGTTVKESMGELLVNIDGRDVPLTVGYHKVTVDVRDQIARTVIEESFVNHTDARLEGVFHFPLPADASISDFGMWIGDELVRADVVEKQRAREIYETILREQRDPGLLEWAGGNIFKARVFPIFAHSEKRVTIAYTQVLPMRNGQYRYTYPLQSEMLRQKPLRELQVTLNLYSAAPLKSVRCITHPARVRQTAGAATVEYSAQECTPDRDFEVAIEPDVVRQPLSAVPHRRGEDGYFLLLLNPPSERAERPLLAGGAPLRLLVLADTSGSLDAGQRKAQADFLRAMLSSLGRDDRFLLAGCDVECVWLTDGFQPPDETTIAGAVDALAARRSLGWSDLDRSFAAAAAKAAAEGPCQIVYVGDGIPATSEIDPVALARRLALPFKDAVARGAACHAVATGSAYEAAVMKALAAQGGGSFRRLDGEGGPARAARELLEELTRPPMRGLAIEFKGLRAARVYPEALPNLPAGAQQAIVGRYQPSSLAPDAVIRVTGKVGGKEVSFEQPLRLPAGEEGNSFIPRLWARHHLDYLLAQGATPEVREQIVGFSQEYRIMTPYTSFLVLESDADRERFGVKRHVAMRDGEAFFAEGRNRGNCQLVQQQMKRAAAWRAGLRRQVLANMARLGRDPLPQALPANGPVCLSGPISAERAESIWSWGGGGAREARAKRRGEPRITDAVSVSGATGADLFLGNGTEYAGDDVSAFNGLEVTLRGKAAPGDRDGGFLEDAEAEADKKELVVAETESVMPLESAAESVVIPAQPAMLKSPVTVRGLYAGRMSGEGFAYRLDLGLARDARGIADYACRARYDRVGDWLNPWTPSLPGLGPSPAPTKKPDAWSEDAFKLAASLDRRPALAQRKATVRVMATTSAYNDRRAGRLASISTTLAVAGPERWLTLSAGDQGIPTLAWFATNEYGAISLPYRLGRTARTPTNAPTSCPLPLQDFSTHLLTHSYAGYQARVEPGHGDRDELVLTAPGNSTYSMRVRIDTKRHVVLEQWTMDGDKTTARTVFDRFREVAGSWCATRVTVQNADGEVVSRTEIDVDALPDDAQAWSMAECVKAESVLVPSPLPDVAASRRAAQAGKATPERLMALVSRFAATQQWEKSGRHFEELRRQLAGKPAMRYLELGYLAVSRRHEELRTNLLAVARGLAADGLPADRALERIGLDRLPERPAELGVANAVRAQSQYLQANERLALLDALRSVYARQPDRVEALDAWQQERADVLRQAGQTEEALAIDAELMRKRPWDANALTRYAQNLANAGDHERAIPLLEGALAHPPKGWQPYDLVNVRGVLLNVLENAGLHDRQIQILERWLVDTDARFGVDSYQYQRYLTALLRADREPQAHKVAAAWIEPLLKGADLPPPALARATAAANFMIGNLYNLYYNSNWIDEKWLPTLAETVRRAAATERTLSIAQAVMGSQRFAQTDTCRELRKAFAGALAAGMPTNTVDGVQAQVNWISANDPAVEEGTWRPIAGHIEKRWARELAAWRASAAGEPARPSLDSVDRWGALAASVYGSHVGAPEQLRFCRRQLAEGPEDHRDSYAQQLFDAYLVQAWSAEYEGEAYALLAKLAQTADGPVRQQAQAAALMRLTDWAVAGCRAAIVAAHCAKAAPPVLPGQADRLSAVPAKPLHELTRTERRQLDTLALELSREGAAARLDHERSRQPESLRPWIDVERLDVLTRLGRSPGDLAKEVIGLLGPRPPERLDSPIEIALFERRLALAEFLVVKEADLARRPKAGATDPAVLTAVLKYERTGLATADSDQRAFWRARLCDLLVALDRSADLEESLRAWSAEEDGPARWHVALAYLLAETDRLRDAVALFESAAAEDELGPAEYQSLSGWYMALDEQEKHREAKLKALEAADEYQLQNRLHAERNKLSRNDWHDGEQGVPPEINPEVFDVLTALLRKTQYPANQAWIVRELYSKTRDFRLLRCLAEGMLGHTAQQVYPFLQNLREILREVRDEATADELAEAIADVRRRAETPVDRRALFLLEADVKRRASEVLNQPGQHVPAALAALQAANRETWSPGEPRLMADYLAALGKITQEPLAREQLAQIEALRARTGESAIDRLEIAHAYARTLGAYERYDQALEVLSGALDEYRSTQGATLPAQANAAADSLVSFCETRGHFVRGESWLRTELARPAGSRQREWLVARLFQLYENAVRRDGETAQGRGATLYAAACAELTAELANPARPQHLQTLAERRGGMARAAAERKFDGVADGLRAFATDVVPGVLRRQSREPGAWQQTAGQVAEALHDIAGPRDGLAFLIGCGETEPAWFRFDYNSFWHQQGHRMGLWRTQVKELGNLEPLLLTLVLRELRADLERQQQRNRTMYHRHNSYFWQEKAESFAGVAEEVYAARHGSGAAVAYIAEYLYYGLDLHGRAIEMALDGWRRGVLDENAQARLVAYLHERNRFAEAIPVLVKLAAWRPDNPSYRRLLMVSDARTGKPEAAEQTRQEAERHFKDKELWAEGAIAELAWGSLESGLFTPAVAYYDEVIALRRRTAPPSAGGDSTLSTYYGNLARSHAGLGDTAAAVDAAAGAVASWGQNQRNRREALSALRRVLAEAKDLDAYVAGLDKRVAETRLDSPIVRKALGQVYAERGKHEEAVAQFRRAIAGQPGDAETHQALVASLDALKCPDGALAALLDFGDLQPRNIDIRRDAYKRLAAMGRADDAERAATAIVEAAPTEAESHAALAALRQEQDRWPEALPHWRRVSELREREPVGLLGLAKAEMHLKRWADAKATLGRLLAQTWPERFGDVRSEAQRLLAKCGE